MNNILIIGPGRVGKTTLSKMIKKRYSNYNVVHSDCIKWAIIRAKGLEKYYRLNIQEQNKFELSKEFQVTLLEFFNSSIRNDTNNDGYILESGQLQPEVVKQYVNAENTRVICLGHGELDKNGIIQLCRHNDQMKDWTYNVSDHDLAIYSQTWQKMNEKLKVKCSKYGFKYIDTSINRLKVLKYIVDELIV